MELASDLTGKTLGQYKLEQMIGEGGLATVYKAYQTNLERWVAVKVLRHRDKELLTRFEQEAKAVAKLRHRNILTVYEYGVAQDWPYIAMQLVEEGTLANHLYGQPFDSSQVVLFTIPIALALHHAHQHGLIHRDVKPSNILMPQPDWPLLADFGLVKVKNLAESITDSDVTLGTPAYMPPEQAEAREVDGRADMYSLGVVMFEMMTGRLPFTHTSPNQLMWAHISATPPSPRSLNPACPPDLEEIILTTLQKSPDDRYPDLEQMAQALTNLITTLPFPIGLPPTPKPMVSVNKPGQANQNIHTQLISQQTVRILLPGQNVTLDLPQPGKLGLVIGRTHSQAVADIDLGPYGAIEMGLSRQHARLTRPGLTWFIEDLGSMNGTYLNKTRLLPGQPTPLKNGDIIRCSHLSFVFLISFEGSR